MSIAGQVTIGGLGSGTDYAAMVEQLKEVEMYYANRLEYNKQDYELEVNAFNQLLGLMNKLEESTKNLGNTTSYIKSTAESTDEKAVSVTADKDAPEGTYTVDVKQLATASIHSFKDGFTKDEDGNFADLTTVVPGEEPSFTYSYQGEDHTITLSEGSTIEDLVNAINDDSANPGVKASLIPSAGEYIFQIQSLETGEEHAVELKESNITYVDPADPTGATHKSLISDVDPAADWHTLEAQNAQFVVNGFEAQVIESSDNSVEGVIEGVEFDLKKVTDEPITITVAQDTEDMKESITEWVDNVNDVLAMVQALQSVDDAAYQVDMNTASDYLDDNGNETDESQMVDIGSVLSGNSSLRMFKSRLNDLVSSVASGFSSTRNNGLNEDTYSMLSEIGITTDPLDGATQGLLIIDEEKLDAAIKDNPNSVANLFAGEGGTTNSQNFRFVDNVADSAGPGNYIVDYTLSEGDTGTLDPDSVYINGAKATLVDGKYTVTDSSSDAYGLSIAFSGGVLTKPKSEEGIYETETVNIMQGKAHALYEFFQAETRELDSDTDPMGGLVSARKSIETTIEDMEKKIEDEIARLDLWESRQKARYARLDAYLGVQNALLTSNAEALAAANITGK